MRGSIMDIFEKNEIKMREMIIKLHRCCKIIDIDLGKEEEFINICMNENCLCSWEQFVTDICGTNYFYKNLHTQVHDLSLNIEKINKYFLFNLTDKRYMLASLINMIEENGIFSENIIIKLFYDIERLNDYENFFIIFSALRKFIYIPTFNNVRYMYSVVDTSMDLLYRFHKDNKKLIKIIGEEYYQNLFLYLYNEVINKQINFGQINLSNLKFITYWIDTYKLLDKKSIYTLMENGIFYKEYAKIDKEYLGRLVLAEIEDKHVLIV